MRARVLLWVPLALLLAADVFAQSRVEGVVRATDGTPLPDVTVTIEGPEYRKAPLTATTDAEGRYVFENVKAGTRVRVVATRAGRRIADGHTLVTQWVETFDLNERPASMVPTVAEDVLAADGPAAALRGVVRSAEGQPVPRARVRLGETAVAASTDSAGRFVFGRIRPGIMVPLNVSAEGYEPSTRNVLAPDAGHVEVDFALAASPVAPGLDEGEGADAAENSAPPVPSTSNPLSLPAVPSPVGTDLFRRLQFLPSVDATIERGDLLAVRGSEPGDTLVAFDGFLLYPTTHPFGAFTGPNADVVREAEFSPDGHVATLGGALSSVLRLASATPAQGRTSGAVDLGRLGAGAYVDVSLAARGSIMFGGRVSPPESLYEDALEQFSSADALWVRDRAPRFSGGTLGEAPDVSFRDVNARLEFRPSAKDRLVLSAHDARDGANDARDFRMPARTDDTFGVPPEGFVLTADAVVQASDVTEWERRGVSGSWDRQWTPHASTSISFGRSEHTRDAAQAFVLADAARGTDLSFLSGRGGSGALVESDGVVDTLLKGSATLGLGFAHVLTIGGEVRTVDIDHALRGEVANAPASGSTPAGSRLAPLYSQAASGRLSTVFVQDAWRPAGRLTVTPGLRVTTYDLAEETWADPRVTASYQVTPEFRFKGGWGLDHQAVGRVVREDPARGDGAFWTVADGARVPVARANKLSLGGAYEIPGLAFEIEAFYRSLDDLSVFAPRLLPGAAPQASAALFHVGSAEARGLEASLLSRTRVNSLIVSYAGGRAEHTFPTLETSAFVADHDRTHQFKIADTVTFARRWSVGGSWILANGRPYTPASAVEPVWFPSGAAGYRVVFGAKNSARLPEYHRLDLSTQVDFRLGRARTTLGAAVFNAYDRKNTARYHYETAGDSVTAYDVLMMGRAYNVFLRVAF